MKAAMLGLLGETAIHHGAGRSTGIIDLPVAREATTDHPFIAGSALKGATRDRAESLKLADVEALFGKPDQAGRLLFSDARLLLLPVRSLTGTYRWATCPLLLERYRRDLTRCGLKRDVPAIQIPAPAGGRRGALTFEDSGTLLLEEREVEATGKPAKNLLDAISPLIHHEDTRKRLERQLVVLTDDDFAWFCRYSLPVQAHNVLEDGTKQSTNLWYEETLPTDTLLYALVMGREGQVAQPLKSLFPENDPYLQVGGNETVGHGWVSVALGLEGVA